MKTVIIPDIHNNYAWAEAVIDREKPDKVIFLGDFFDSYGDEANDEMVVNTAKWLQQSVNQPNRIHLFGNHDIWYSCGDPRVHCPGNNEHKRWLINCYFKDWNKIRPYYWLDNWLCTHAGLTRPLWEALESSYITVQDLMLDTMNSKDIHVLLRLVGRGRGGNSDHGGILWCHFEDNPDYNEFFDIKGIKQIFGHTASQHVRTNDKHICLDCYGTAYAVYQNGKMRIKTDKIIKYV